MDNRIYKAIVNAIPDMIIRIGRNGVFQSFEGATAELYWPAAAYLGKHLNDVLPPETADLFTRKINAAFHTNNVQYLEYALPFNGCKRHYESRMIRSRDDEALVIVRNVTREKQVEDELNRHQEDLEALVQERTAELTRAEISC